MNQPQKKTISDFSPYVTPCQITLAQRHSLMSSHQQMHSAAAGPLHVGISTFVSQSTRTPTMKHASEQSYPKEALKAALFLPDVLLDDDSAPDDKRRAFTASNASYTKAREYGPARVVTETDIFRLQQTVSDLQTQLQSALNVRKAGSGMLGNEATSMSHQLSGTPQIVNAVLPATPTSRTVEVVSENIPTSHACNFHMTSSIVMYFLQQETPLNQARNPCLHPPMEQMLHSKVSSEFESSRIISSSFENAAFYSGSKHCGRRIDFIW